MIDRKEPNLPAYSQMCELKKYVEEQQLELKTTETQESELQRQIRELKDQTERKHAEVKNLQQQMNQLPKKRKKALADYKNTCSCVDFSLPNGYNFQFMSDIRLI